MHQYFLTPDKAGGTRSFEMARRLVAHGHEVHMLTTWFDSKPPTTGRGWFSREVDGIIVHWLPVPYSNKMGFARRLWAFIRFAFGAGRKASKIGGDVIFATSTPLTIAIPAVHAKRRLKIPMVFEVRDLWPEVPIAMNILRNSLLIRLARWLEKYAYRNADRIVALSPGMADGVVCAGYDRDRIFVIPNSCDLELFKSSQAAARSFRDQYRHIGDGPIILYPGTLGRVNGVSWLVDLAVRVRVERPDIQFVVIGDGVERDFVMRRAEDEGVLNETFYLIPPLAKRAIVSAYAAASAVISLCIDNPALHANSANKFFDALASSTPILINYGGWQKDLIEGYGAGVALDPDINLAAPALINFMSSSDVLTASGLAARQLGEDRFSRDALAQKMEDVLLGVVKSI
jgi:glycosyltransferase involved in cell wall biosynthesis